MKILLIGRSGQIGHALVSRLPASVELVSPGRAQLDLSNLSQVREVVRATRPQIIINAAACTDVEGAEHEPALAMRVNGEALGVIAEEGERAGAFLVHYSTDYVFDGTKGGLYEESDATHPINAYGVSKLAGERAVQASRIPHVILRTSWVYSLRRKNFLTAILRLWKQGQTLRVVDDQFGTPTSARMVAGATIDLIDSLIKRPDQAHWPQSEIYHVAASGLVSRFAFARAAIAWVDAVAANQIEPVSSAAFSAAAATNSAKESAKESAAHLKRPSSSGLSNMKFSQKCGALPAWEEDLRACLSEKDLPSVLAAL